MTHTCTRQTGLVAQPGTGGRARGKPWTWGLRSLGRAGWHSRRFSTPAHPLLQDRQLSRHTHKLASRRLPNCRLQSNSEARGKAEKEGGSQGRFLWLHMNRQVAGVGEEDLHVASVSACSGQKALEQRSPHPLWHEGLVSQKTIFPGTRVGGMVPGWF